MEKYKFYYTLSSSGLQVPGDVTDVKQYKTVSILPKWINWQKVRKYKASMGSFFMKNC